VNSENTNQEPARLEDLWSGDFGDDYVDRNIGAYEIREPFWRSIVDRVAPTRVLEVGCNVGGNLRWIAPSVPPGSAYGVDVNRKALAALRETLPDVNTIWTAARELPFRDDFFDFVFTMGVLIHQPEESVRDVMSEMVRCSSRFVLCGEYFSADTVDVPYRGVEGALFKRDYGKLFTEVGPSLSLVESGHLSADEGFDDITWWLFEK
jgi:pseudaminic acid biosynthesis-associated methylase